jgi:diguanylate cyclase (GGDEF)-like protein/PAS domain S-box-containing protein
MMNRFGPVVRIAVGLVSLTMFLLLIGDLGLHLFRDDVDFARQVRKRTSENLAVQLTSLIQKNEVEILQRTIDEVVRRANDVDSLGVRKNDGEVLAQSAEHPKRWKAPTGDQSTLTHVKVPVFAGSDQWGQIEISYRPATPQNWIGWLKHPTVLGMLLMSIGGFILYYWFIRRVLEHLDPTKAIPDRVRKALDSLTEGVMVLDFKGRIVLANRAFRDLAGASDQKLLAREASDVPWLRAGLPDDPAQHPWNRAIAEETPATGDLIEIARGDGVMRKATVSAAPILDGQGTLRGCLVSFNDVTALDRANTELRTAMDELNKSRKELEIANEDLQKLASIDPLTGVMNRRAFFAKAEELFPAAVASGEALCVVLTDIDKFKTFNDTHGHATGDLVLQLVARTLKAALRPNDIMCRYGGEEFCILLPETRAAQAKVIAERIRFRVEAQCGPGVRTIPGLKVTSSFGIAALEFGADSLQDLIERADEALYKAKETGRNRVIRHDEIAPASSAVDADTTAPTDDDRLVATVNR